MRNLNTLIVGRTGSGKTTLVKALILLTARVIVLDRKMEYEFPDAFIAYTLEDAIDFLLVNRWKPFKLIFRPTNPEDYFELMVFAENMQKVEPHGPLVIVMEEASAYSTTNNIDPIVLELYNAGRHRRISLLTVIQRDTSIHPITRTNSEVIVSMSQTKLSGDMQGYFGNDVVEALVSVKQDYTDTPIQDHHFAVYPPDTDLYETWIDHHGYIAKQGA